LAWRYRNIPDQLKKVGFQAPSSWSEQHSSISLFQKIAILLLFFPYHILTSLGYQIYKLRANRKLKVPKIIFSGSHEVIKA